MAEVQRTEEESFTIHSNCKVGQTHQHMNKFDKSHVPANQISQTQLRLGLLCLGAERKKALVGIILK